MTSPEPIDPSGQGGPDGIVAAVSTVKDTLPRLEQYVARNLAGGVDHLFVLLDADQPEVADAFAGHPHVTCVRTDDAWWADGRPPELNHRQRINANAVRSLLGDLGWASWLFHVDGDEVVRVDRQRLAAVPAATPAVRLEVREAVSRMRWEQPPTWFKRPLEKPELRRLVRRGVIARPSNGVFLHGHADGKAGVRPAGDAWLTLHDPVGPDGGAVETAADASFLVLHYESYSGEEFARKWTALAQAGPDTRLRPVRQRTMDAVQELLARGLAPDALERELLALYERTIAEDLDLLRELGVVEHIDADRGAHRPAALTDEQRAQLAAGLDRLVGRPKAGFRPPANRPTEPPAVTAAPRLRRRS